MQEVKSSTYDEIVSTGFRPPLQVSTGVNPAYLAAKSVASREDGNEDHIYEPLDILQETSN